MVDGLDGPFFHAMLRVDQDNETEHELAPTHPLRVAELTVREMPYKRSTATTDHALASCFNADMI